MSCDPWDEVPTALEEDDESPERWDPDEILARCLHRARHAGPGWSGAGFFVGP